jgi:amino acid adenylation domain-containing protein
MSSVGGSAHPSILHGSALVGDPRTTRIRSLAELFVISAQRFPERTALEVEGERWSYRSLAGIAQRLAALMIEHRSGGTPPGAVLGARSAIAYQGVLGTLLSGSGYVALNPRFPEQRNGHMLEVSGSQTLVVDEDSICMLAGVLACSSRPLVVILPSRDDVSTLSARHPGHRFLGAREVGSARAAVPLADGSALAYILFTSGSTGLPKGVMVSHANVLHHLNVMWSRYAIDENDRFSQTFDLTFDLSVFDMFACWGKGASLHCVPSKQLMAPDKFIRESALTIWFSVPSVGMALRRLRLLKPGAFPSLRVSLFCGERLPADVAEHWQAAAPCSIVENLYGPTEVTIACTLHRWRTDHSKERCVGGVVPIGVPYEGMSAAVVDDELQLVAAGERGELCMRGPQVSIGYLGDEKKTNERYVAMPWFDGPDNRWYRTGDVAYVDSLGELIHCGRNDEQVKLRGYRVEIGEVEHVVRAASNTDFVAVLPFPFNEQGPTGLTAVVAGTEIPRDKILAVAREKLADYMVPDDVVQISELPLNANGKIDRKRLLQLLMDKR